MKKEQRNLLLFIALNFLVCLLYFYPIIFRLNEVLLCQGGDGIKNYFTYLYFVQFDSGTTFTGMNYPFGENIVFTDNMPLLSWSLAKLKVVFPDIVHYALFFMHSVMIGSFVLSSIFVKKILHFFDVRGWWAVVSAVFISFFSPQILRMGAHFSLSLACFIPMLFYWMLKFEKERKVKFLFYISIATIVLTFFHVYFLAIGLIFISTYSLAYLLTNHQKVKTKIKFCLALLSAVIFPIIVFKFYLYVNDPVKDRPKFPFGFLGAATTGEDILTSKFNFIGANVFSFLFGRAADGAEGYTYLGFITILISFFMLYRIIKGIVLKTRKKIKIPSHPIRAYRTWLLTAFFVLLFAMGVPFVWFESLIDYFSTFRQFRSIGRFSWIFYNIMAVYAAIMLYRTYFFLQKRKYIKVAYLRVVIVLILGVYFIELNGYAQRLKELHHNAHKSYSEYFYKGEHRWDNWLRSKGIDLQKFQGSIGLPYFHIGSEKVGQSIGSGLTFCIGSQIAMQTKLSMTNVMMSRTSWSQTFNQLSLFDGPFSPKHTLKFYNNKPFLLFVNTYEKLSFGEQWLLKHATPIGNKSGFDIYEVDLKKLPEMDKQFTDSVVSIAKLNPRQEGLLENDGRFTYSLHFDDGLSKDAFVGSHAYKPKGEHRDHFATIPIANNTADTSFIFSTWFKCFLTSDYMPYMIYEQLDKEGNKVAEGDYLSWDGNGIIGDWFLAEREIIIHKKTVSIKLYVIGGSKKYIAMDELLIRPKGVIHFYKANDSTYLLNNRPVKISH